MLLAATRPQDPAFGKQGVGQVGTAPHAMGCTRLLGLPRFVRSPTHPGGGRAGSGGDRGGEQVDGVGVDDRLRPQHLTQRAAIGDGHQCLPLLRRGRHVEPDVLPNPGQRPGADGAVGAALREEGVVPKPHRDMLQWRAFRIRVHPQGMDTLAPSAVCGWSYGLVRPRPRSHTPSSSPLSWNPPSGPPLSWFWFARSW